MSEELEALMLRRQEYEKLSGELMGIIESHREHEPRLMDIFESLALRTSDVFELSLRYDLTEDEVSNAFRRARTILSQHTSLRPYLDLFG